MSRVRVLAFSSILAVITSSTLAAQQTGSLGGRVSGPNGNPVSNARVRVVDSNRTATTDQTGNFFLTGLPPGSRTLIVEYLGFKPDTVTADVQAAQVGRVDVALELAAVILPGIVVEGERGGQLRAINQQRLALNTINVVSADEIGRLPDQNVAEAAQRTAGVSIQTSRGEGRFVSIRGTAPNLNNVTFNGQTLASTAESRATALDLLPASMVASIEITKAVTPDMDANAVGGTVDIKTLSAFDRSGPFWFGSVKGLTHQQVANYGDDKQPYEGELTFGRRFGPQEQWGVVFAGNASRRDFKASVLDPDGWERVDQSIIPAELELQVEDNERERYGFSTALDWRPTPFTSLYARALYTHTREIVANSEYEFGFEGDLTMQSQTVGRFTAGSAELDLSEDDEKESLYALTIGGNRRFGSLLWDVAGTFTRGVFDRVGPDATFETAEDNELLLASTFDVGPYFFTIDPDDPGFISNPLNYPLRSSTWSVESNRENTWVGATNLSWTRLLGQTPVHFKLGGKFQMRDKVIDDIGYQYEPADGLTLQPYALPTTFTAQGGYDSFVHGNTRTFAQYFDNNRNNTTLFTLDEAETQLNSVEGDSDNLEHIYAGYLMATAELGKFSLLGGARVERTRTESRRYELSINDDTEEVQIGDRSFDRSYMNVLPALIAKWNLSDRMIVRAAFTSTLGRPDYEELAGFREVSFEPTAVPNVFEGSVSEGNPDLKPYEARNLDFSLEYYFPLGGLLSLGAFDKRIDNPIYDYEVNHRDTLFEGRQYAELSYSQDRNAEAGTLRGIELSYSQPLFFLPKPFDGLGITANAAFIASEVRVPGREAEKLTFFGQPDRVINIIPYFQRGPLELRFAWTYRGSYLTEVGEEAFEDRYGDRRETIDITGRFSLLRDRVRLLAQVRNLTNEPEIGYQGNVSRYDVHTLTGRTVTFGISASH
jgi:TonB-dependent receptor